MSRDDDSLPRRDPDDAIPEAGVDVRVAWWQTHRDALLARLETPVVERFVRARFSAGEPVDDDLRRSVNGRSQSCEGGLHGDSHEALQTETHASEESS